MKFVSHQPLFNAACLALAGLTTPAVAQVEYELSFEPGAGGSWSVEASFPDSGGEVMDLWLARWTAGAYHLADFGRFVEMPSAQDAAGTKLPVERVSESHFRIAKGAAERVIVHYRAESISEGVFTRGVIDVESNRIAEDYAYVTPVSLFGFVPELVGEEVVLEVALPAGWRAATALEADEDGRFHAPSYYHFEDSPLLFSADLHTVRFEVDGKPHAVSVHGKGKEETAVIADGCRRIVEATSALMDGLPYSHYHFLFGFTPKSGGSGLEHSFSTLILLPSALDPARAGARALWGIVAHEFFHTWCAERIHVEGLHRPDYTKPFSTGTIWVNEGVTEYFAHHILLHAGLVDRDGFLRALAGSRLSAKGRATSWTDTSRAATHWTEGAGVMDFTSAMYGSGPKVILALDLEMRRITQGERGIVDLLHLLRHEYIDRDRGFPEGAMIGLINDVTEGDLTGFYESYIAGTDYPDLAAALEVIGYSRNRRKIVEVDEPSEDQLRARADFFSIPR
ncbi:MAG: hypothetical protein GY711_06770 [bacterium]|nr:hypothetical protein [bacterium]